MFREMRRKAKELSLEETLGILETARRGVLAVNGDDGYPYAVPVDFLYDREDSRIYVHGAKAGHKYEAIKNCDKVCFTVCGNPETGETDWAPYVKSAVVFGRCRITEDVSEVTDKLRLVASKYYPSKELADAEVKKHAANAAIYVITPEHICGKRIQEK